MLDNFDKNHLFFGDNLEILRSYIPSESVDLIYLDPPFNSDRDYNVLFRDTKGVPSEAQIEVFTDTWQWTLEAEKLYNELVLRGTKLGSAIEALRTITGQTSPMSAYLVMMGIRLVELHRTLKATGSLYLHCDPTASHYLKILLDTIFGPQNFKNEIIWRRTGAHNKVKKYGPIHDTILFYTKSDVYTWNAPKRPYMKGHIDEFFVEDDKGYRTNYFGNVLTGSGSRNGESGKPWLGVNPTVKGRHWAIPGSLIEDLDEDISHLSQHEKLDYLYERGYIKFTEGQAWPIYERYLKPSDGQLVPDIWAFQPYTEGTVFSSEHGIDFDIRWISPRDQERLGYPTQKPLGLLKRIIEASSNLGDVILDPFAGCGTTVSAAQLLNRKWIGVDVTFLAIAAIGERLKDMFPGIKYEVIGEPKDLNGAQALAESKPNGRYQFQWWILFRIGALPFGSNGGKEGKKGTDKGIDGQITFMDEKGKGKKVIIQVKSGHVSSQTIRDLVGTITREKAAIGVLITLEEPTKPMVAESLSAGIYHSPTWNKDYQKIQILTVAEILKGKHIDMPPAPPQLRKAQKVTDNLADQHGFDLEL